MQKKKKGFTLAELLIVVAIIAVLVAISIPIFNSQLKKARRATDQANVRSAKAAAAAQYMTDGETGPVSYLYAGGKAIALTDSSAISSAMSTEGYGKSDTDDNKNSETGASGTPKNAYVEVTVNDSDQNQITAKWVSSPQGAAIAATGTYSFKGDVTQKSIGEQLSAIGVSPDEVTAFKAEEGSNIDETVESDGKGKRDREGVLVNTFQQFPNLKSIDLSGATLKTGNINLFAELPKSVQEIRLPKSDKSYDIRGTWYYAGGAQVLNAPNTSSGADPAKDSRITTGHDGAAIYRTREAAIAAGTKSSQ